VSLTQEVRATAAGYGQTFKKATGPMLKRVVGRGKGETPAIEAPPPAWQETPAWDDAPAWLTAPPAQLPPDTPAWPSAPQ
jgi:cytochrome c2